MVKRDLHTHTAFGDGNNTPEEMVVSALEKGLDCIGLCVHSYTAFDEECCIPERDYPVFTAEVKRLKEKYAGKIEVLCGVEQDYYSEADTSLFDYVIGSVHYVLYGGEYIPVDNTSRLLESGCLEHFGGDYYALAEKYYENVSRIAEKTHCDIIGHFDLITKFNEGGVLFDENNPGYIESWKKAVDALIPCGIPFEINTGAISRGCRTAPYPAKQIRDYILSKGGKLILSSDAHDKNAVAFGFREYAPLL